MKSTEEREKREQHRNQVVKDAVNAADRIILDGSDGSCEETNYLTSEVARKMMERAFNPFCVEMLKKDLE